MSWYLTTFTFLGIFNRLRLNKTYTFFIPVPSNSLNELTSVCDLINYRLNLNFGSV